ncbi:MAG TPA: hypothetical protein VFO10_02715 [Oligoflexus sp.]|uniref:hypothetical protein n=1 Tax=Oligoflexus sp. TaxID=1971216 RepID=UPI002D800C8C|nr:hypothetical protein [Oligoflexus sp.]HET9236134.1 hypothetical protein [Oligoflexus sp.]
MPERVDEGLKILSIKDHLITFEMDGVPWQVSLKRWKKQWRQLEDQDLSKARFRDGMLELPLLDVRIPISFLKRLATWKPPMKIYSIKIVADWIIEATFDDGTTRRADVRDIPFSGAFLRIKTDLDFFYTCHEEGLFPCWGDLTLDSDFLHKNSKPVEEKK